MSVLIAPELPANIVAIETIETVPEPESSHDDALCYLCPPGTPSASAKATCYYCDRPVCATHNPGYLGWCMMQIDACPECAAKQTEEHAGFNGSHRPKDSTLRREVTASLKAHHARQHEAAQEIFVLS